MAHIIVVGNEKGGAGKSTMSIHIATALVRSGRSVGALDLDLRQKSFARYIENRAATCKRDGLALSMPDYRDLGAPPTSEPGPALDERFATVLEPLVAEKDFVLIDCPGSHTRLSQLAHSLADTLITPLNDSFIDFDLLARHDPETGRILGPSIYSEMVWAARQRRAEAGLAPIDWVVLRNRLGVQKMHNKRRMGDALQELSRRIGFRVGPGFSERVIFRELFPRGLTLLDLREAAPSGGLAVSHIAARQELRALLAALNLPGRASAS